MAVPTEVSTCPHVPAVIAAPRAEACEECGDRSDLRMCTECGHVGCCESHLSHGRDHALAQHHPVIKSLPLTADHFTWCYECDRYV